MKKYPILDRSIHTKKNLTFEFDCGDLWLREDVNTFDDINKCQKIIFPEVEKYEKKFTKGLEEFEWSMSYTYPDSFQLEDLKKNNKKKYFLKDYNFHIFCPMSYHKKDKTLQVYEDLIGADYYLVSLVADLIKDIKEINFGLGTLYGDLTDLMGNDHEYFEKKLKNKSWMTWVMEIKEPYMPESEINEGEFGNDLDGLIYIRNQHPKIKISFDHVDEDEKKILKKYSII